VRYKIGIYDEKLFIIIIIMIVEIAN